MSEYPKAARGARPHTARRRGAGLLPARLRAGPWWSPCHPTQCWQCHHCVTLDRMSVGNTNSEIPGREMRIAVIVGSTRPGRRGDAVADWVRRIGARRGDAAFEVLDIARFGLPLLDEPVPAAIGD